MSQVMETTSRAVRRPKLRPEVAARNFGLRLLMGTPRKSLFITRDPETKGLKVTLLKADSHVNVDVLKATILEKHPGVQLLDPCKPKAITFKTPKAYSFDEVYQLLHMAAL